MRARKFSLQVTGYRDGTYSVAIIHQSWEGNGWRHDKPLFKRVTDRAAVQAAVDMALQWVIEGERREELERATKG